MGSAPSLDVPSWEGQTPTDQAPLQSSNPPINYTGSYGQPGNNFQGMGKSPQTGGGMPQAPGGMPQASNVPSNPMAQGGHMQQPQMQPQMQQQGSGFGDYLNSNVHSVYQQAQMGGSYDNYDPVQGFMQWQNRRR